MMVLCCSTLGAPGASTDGGGLAPGADAGATYDDAANAGGGIVKVEVGADEDSAGLVARRC